MNIVVLVSGGGFYENIPRMLKDGCSAKIDLAKVPHLPIFDLLQKTGNIPTRDMYNTFNMGMGMCMAVAKEDADKAVAALREAGEEAVIVGEIVAGDKEVLL